MVGSGILLDMFSGMLGFIGVNEEKVPNKVTSCPLTPMKSFMSYLFLTGTSLLSS